MFNQELQPAAYLPPSFPFFFYYESDKKKIRLYYFRLLILELENK